MDVQLSLDELLSQELISKWLPENSTIQLFIYNPQQNLNPHMFSIGKAGIDCACDLINGEIDSGLYWTIFPEIIPQIESVLRDVHSFTKNGFSFQAIWADDKVLEEKDVKIEEIVQLLQKNRIGTNTRY